MSLFHQLFYRYIDDISPSFDSSHMIFQLLSICVNRLLVYYLGFCLHLSVSFCLASPCIKWLWLASSYPDFNPCTLWFYLFRFNFWTCCNITCVLLFSSHGLLLDLLTMRPSSCTYTHLLLLIDWFLFYHPVILYPHLTKCTPISMTCNNFTAFISLFVCLFS